jgi:hypothetical protein
MKKPAKQRKIEVGSAAMPADLQERIHRRAFELWELCGREHGRDTEHWLQAEREVNQQTKTIES